MRKVNNIKYPDIQDASLEWYKCHRIDLLNQLASPVPLSHKLKFRYAADLNATNTMMRSIEKALGIKPCRLSPVEKKLTNEMFDLIN